MNGRKARRLRPAARELLRRFIREADAPGAPWPPVDRRRVHVVVDGTRAELEELLGEAVDILRNMMKTKRSKNHIRAR